MYFTDMFIKYPGFVKHYDFNFLNNPVNFVL